MKRVLVFACLLLIGCEDNINNLQPPDELKKSTESVRKEYLGKEFKLKIGEEVILPKESLRIKFVSVPEDSRCPLAVNCFWSGNAKTVLEYQKDANPPVSASLNTNLKPDKLRYQNYLITLKKLEPYPVEPGPISQTEYTATILVKKITNGSKEIGDM